MKYETVKPDFPSGNPAPVGKVKIRVFDGPHHGRMLIIPTKTSMYLSLPASLPKGETFRETRTNPSAWAKYIRVTYERRTGSDGEEYLSYLAFEPEVIAVEFDVITEVPATKVVTRRSA